MAVGDLLRSHNDRWVPVESIVDGKECPVYNLLVERNATCFVGGDDWGFSLWVYATCSKAQAPPKGLLQSKTSRVHANSRGPREFPGPYARQRRTSSLERNQ